MPANEFADLAGLTTFVLWMLVPRIAFGAYIALRERRFRALAFGCVKLIVLTASVALHHILGFSLFEQLHGELITAMIATGLLNVALDVIAMSFDSL